MKRPYTLGHRLSLGDGFRLQEGRFEVIHQELFLPCGNIRIVIENGWRIHPVWALGANRLR